MQTWANPDLCWGDQSLAALPRQCLIGWPELITVPWGHRPMSAYEGLVGMLAGRGLAVPSHPSACQGDGCGHAKVWHRHRTRLRPCEVPGCGCADFFQEDTSRSTREARR